MKIKRLNESFELVKPEEETIDTVEVVEETLTEASENPWDKLVKAYPELTEAILDEGNPITRNLPASIDSMLQDMAQMFNLFEYNDVVNFIPTEDSVNSLKQIYRKWRNEAQYESDETESILQKLANEAKEILLANANESVAESVVTEEKDPYDKLVDAYPELEESVSSWDEYDDQYEFDNEDDVVEQDRMHAALYGGDREYCDKCGSKLVMDEWGGSCPKCNAEEIFDAKYDDDVSYFDDESIDEAKEKVSSRAKKILSPLTREEAIVRAQSLLKNNPECDGVCYGIERDFFEPYCITADEAERIGAGKQMVYVLWNRNK